MSYQNQVQITIAQVTVRIEPLRAPRASTGNVSTIDHKELSTNGNFLSITVDRVGALRGRILAALAVLHTTHAIVRIVPINSHVIDHIIFHVNGDVPRIATISEELFGAFN